MASELISFRDKGCQGAQNIIKSGLTLAKGTKNCTNSLPSEKPIHLFFSENNPNLPFWKEAALILGIDLLVSSPDKFNSTCSSASEICIIEEKTSTCNSDTCTCTLIAQKNSEHFKSSYALDVYINLVYHCLKHNKEPHQLSIAWIGDCLDMYTKLSSAFIEGAICLQYELAFAFPQSPASAPESDILDFSLRAGAKIFLTYDLDLITPPDILYIAPWTFPQSTGLSPQHPFLAFPDKEDFEASSLVSFLPNLASSPIDEKLYSQAAVYTIIAALGYFYQNKG